MDWLSLAGGAAALGFGFRAVEGADTLRTFAAVEKGLAWAPCLANLNLLGKAPQEMKEFNEVLKLFLAAYEKQNTHEIALNAQNVQEKLRPLLENRPSYYDNFKGWSYSVGDFFTFRKESKAANWDQYLKPLHDLNQELATLQKGLENGQGYSLEDLNAPLKNSYEFMVNEVQAHTGVFKKVATGVIDGTANAVKDKYAEVSGANALKEKIRLPLNPLIQLNQTLFHLRTDNTPFSFSKEHRVKTEIEAIAKSHPLMGDLPRYIQSNQTPNCPLIDEVDTLVTDYLKSTLNRTEIPHSFLQPLFVTMSTMAQPGAFDPKDPQELAKDGLKIYDKGLKTPEDRLLFWTAFSQTLNMDKIQSLAESLPVGKKSTLSEVSEKIDRTLAFLSTVESMPHAQELGKNITQNIQDLAWRVFELVEFELEPEEFDKVDRILGKVNTLSKAGRYSEALRTMKTLFEYKPFGDLAVKSSTDSSPATKLQEMVHGTTRAEVTPSPDEIRASEQEIKKKKEALVETLTYFAAFQAVDKYCGYKGDDASEEAVQKRYKELYQKLEEIKTPEKRQEKFIELLDQMIENQKNLGFFDKWMGKKLSHFRVSLVQYFTEQFTNIATDEILKMMRSPVYDPLANNHMGPLRAANNAMLELLFGENEWAQDETGLLGIKDKQGKIHEIIDNQQGIKTATLVNEIISGAIDHFIAYRSFGSVFGSLKGRVKAFGDTKGNILTRTAASTLSGVGQLLLNVVTIPAYLAMNAGIFAERMGARLIIHQMELVNSSLTTVRDAIYTDRKYAEGLDKILLDQLKQLEGLLGAESSGGGKAKLLAGDKEKALVSEFVSNLFAVLDKQGQLTPGQRKTRDNMLSQLADALNGATDQIIQDVIRDLIVFSYQSIRNEYGINKLFGDILDQAAQGFKPNDINRLWELYSDEELRKLKIDPENRKASDIKIIENDFITKREITEIHKGDIDKALQELYASREQEIHEILGRVLERGVETVVKTSLDSMLMTPQDATLSAVAFLEDALVPHIQMRRQKRNVIPYITKMQQLFLKSDTEGMKELHKKFVGKLAARLEDLNARKGRDPRSDLQMQMLERMVNRLFEHNLEPLNKALEKGEMEKIKAQLENFLQMIRTEEQTLATIRFNVETREKTIVDTLAEGSKTFVKWASDAVSPGIQAYVKSRLAPRAEGILRMTKDPNVFTALCRSSAEQFLQYERRDVEDPRKNVSTAARDARANGFTFVSSSH